MSLQEKNKIDESLANTKKLITRKSQRQNVMKAIYQISINEDFVMDKLYFDINKKVDKKKIDKENAKECKLLDELNKLIKSFASDEIKENFEIKDFLSDDDTTILYEITDYKDNVSANIEEYEDLSYFKSMIKSFINNKEEIDKKIQDTLFDNWKLNRLSKIDLSILRTAITDILFIKTPYKVAVNEALNLAKEYSDEKSSKFVNGVLKEYIKQFFETEEK